MTSSLEKAIQKARVDHEKRRAAHGMLGHDAAPQASGLFRTLAHVAVKPVTMERNKLIPAIEDKAAVTAYKVLRTRVLQRIFPSGPTIQSRHARAACKSTGDRWRRCHRRTWRNN